MIEIILLFGKLVFLALLYLFLFAVARAGLGLVRAGAPVKAESLFLSVVRGPSELTGVKLPLKGPLVIGRSPEADVVVGDEFVSSKHARVALSRGTAVVEDLGSTNGTLLNGRPVRRTAALKPGDSIEIGSVEIRLERS